MAIAFADLMPWVAGLGVLRDLWSSYQNYQQNLAAARAAEAQRQRLLAWQPPLDLEGMTRSALQRAALQGTLGSAGEIARYVAQEYYPAQLAADRLRLAALQAVPGYPTFEIPTGQGLGNLLNWYAMQDLLKVLGKRGGDAASAGMAVPPSTASERGAEGPGAWWGWEAPPSPFAGSEAP